MMNVKQTVIQIKSSNPHFSSRQIQKLLKEEYGVKVDGGNIRRYVRGMGGKAIPGGSLDDIKVKKSYSEKSGEVEVESYKVKTLAEALEIAKVDLEAWMVDRWIANSWPTTMKVAQADGTEKAISVTNHQVKVWLKPKIRPASEIAIENLIKEIPKFKFTRKPQFNSPSGVAGEMALIDAHFAKMAWGKETQRRDYDLKIARDDYLNACEQNLNFMSPFKVEKIFFIVGQDLMHTESFVPKTFKAGHVLDVDSRLPKIFQTAMETVMKCIYMCRDLAPVEVLWIPGNHDAHASMYLCYVLQEHFRNDDHVEVDVSPPNRKARLWGNLLVGWTHEIVGKHTAWTNELAQAFPQMWGKSKFREWHHGHKHKKNEVKTHPVMTHGGVLMRQLTALSPIDAWHYEYLFVDAVPGGESFLWSKDAGVIANFTAWTKK